MNRQHRFERVVDEESTTEEQRPTRSELADYRRRRVGRALSKLAIGGYLVSLPLQALQFDIALNKMEVADTTATVHAIAEAKDGKNSDKATVFVDGFASKNPSWTTEKMTSALQTLRDGNVWALEYADDGISVPDIAEKIAQKAEAKKIHSVTLYGYSIGGMVVLDTAYELIKKYNLHVDSIVLDHTPVNGDSIRQGMRNQASPAVEAISTFHKFGIEIEYSSTARGIINQIFSKDINHLRGTPMNLMLDQYLFGIEANTQRSMERLGETTPTPSIFYVTSAEPKTDYMVDVATSENSFRDMSTTYKIPFHSIPIEGAIHSWPAETVPQYETAFHEAIIALEEEQKAKKRDDVSYFDLLDGSNYASGEQDDQKKTQR